LISPTVAVASFNAATGASVSAIRNVVEARFPVSQSSHDARVVTNGAGQRKGEGCVVYDGTRWSQSCAASAYSSASSSFTCTCNVTAATLAIAAAEFVVDCSGAFGGSAVLDACKTCGGSVIDSAKCSLPLSGETLNTAAIIGASVGGCFVVAVAAFAYYKRNQRQKDAAVAFETKPPQATVIAPPSEPQPNKTRPFLRSQNSTSHPDQSPSHTDAEGKGTPQRESSGLAPDFRQIIDGAAHRPSRPFVTTNVPAAIDAAANRSHSPNIVLPGSPDQSRTVHDPNSTDQSYSSRLAIRVAESALNPSRSFARVPTPGSSAAGVLTPVPNNADRYKQLLAMQRQLSDIQAGVLSPSSPVEVKPSSPPPLIQNPFPALNRPQIERPRLDSSPTAAAFPADSSEARHQHLLMTRQRFARLGSSGTILPADSPAVSLPTFPTASGQYGDIIAARMQRLQQVYPSDSSPPKQD